VVELKRKKGESFESFVRRFSRRLQQSGKLYEVRQRKHVVPKINKNKQKLRALVGRKLHSTREYLKKTGKLKEETRKRW
jgi:ribosomal protein S21